VTSLPLFGLLFCALCENQLHAICGTRVQQQHGFQSVCFACKYSVTFQNEALRASGMAEVPLLEMVQIRNAQRQEESLPDDEVSYQGDPVLNVDSQQQGRSSVTLQEVGVDNDSKVEPKGSPQQGDELDVAEVPQLEMVQIRNAEWQEEQLPDVEVLYQEDPLLNLNSQQQGRESVNLQEVSIDNDSKLQPKGSPQQGDEFDDLLGEVLDPPQDTAVVDAVGNGMVIPQRKIQDAVDVRLGEVSIVSGVILSPVDELGEFITRDDVTDGVPDAPAVTQCKVGWNSVSKKVPNHPWMCMESRKRCGGMFKCQHSNGALHMLCTMERKDLGAGAKYTYRGCYRIYYQKRLADDADLESSPAGNTRRRRLLHVAGNAVDGNSVAEGDVEGSAMEQSAENRSVASLHNLSTVARNRLPRGKCFISISDLCICLAYFF